MSMQWPKSCGMRILELKKKKWDKKYGVEINLKNSICNKTKKKLESTLKTQNVMQQKNSICGKKKLRIKIMAKPKY